MALINIISGKPALRKITNTYFDDRFKITCYTFTEKELAEVRDRITIHLQKEFNPNIKTIIFEKAFGFGNTVGIKAIEYNNNGLILSKNIPPDMYKFITILLSIAIFRNDRLEINMFENNLHYTTMENLFLLTVKFAKEFNTTLDITTSSYEFLELVAEQEDLDFTYQRLNYPIGLNESVYTKEEFKTAINNNIEVR